MVLSQASLYVYKNGRVFDLSINTINGTDYVYDHDKNTGYHSFASYMESEGF